MSLRLLFRVWPSFCFGPANLYIGRCPGGGWVDISTDVSIASNASVMVTSAALSDSGAGVFVASPGFSMPRAEGSLDTTTTVRVVIQNSESTFVKGKYLDSNS